MKQSRLKRIVKRVDDLPTLPKTVLSITELVNNPKSSARGLARIVSDDQVLTARLLKLVNSSFYGFPQKISTVTGAVVLLGFDAIRNLLLTTSVFDLFPAKKNKNQTKQEKLWDHSLGCALGAKVIGAYLRYDNLEELFVSGLLHDIGKIVEMLFLPKDFEQIISIVERENVLMMTAEEAVLGYTHAEIGKLLAEKWNLPAKLVRIISCHHTPELAGPYVNEAAIVHLADILCRAINTGSAGDKKIPPLNTAAWDALQLNVNAIEPIMEEIGWEFDELSLFMNKD